MFNILYVIFFSLNTWHVTEAPIQQPILMVCPALPELNISDFCGAFAL